MKFRIIKQVDPETMQETYWLQSKNYFFGWVDRQFGTFSECVRKARELKSGWVHIECV